eukprot:TRINITY_DN16180_c0_g1_i11.p1 TRINITY_DN16180_c0_g1~~TRINITY_DN16180_c0_g1_i11.p1  ORF type:complete len:531 (+),score=143.88 TRINITY_DN16180_c0_g1_i11:149-1741(+)
MCIRDSINAEYGTASNFGMASVMEEELGEDTDLPMMLNKTVLEAEQQEKTPKPKRMRKKRSRINSCLTMCKYPLIWDTAGELGWNTVEEDELWNVFWTDMSVSTERAMKMSPFQKINHFPGMSEIARKNGLARNLNRMAKTMQDHSFDFYPKTWILPADAAELHQQSLDKKVRTYICKPSKGCQGNGIFLTRNLDEVDTSSDSVVQRYLHKPLLVDNTKFDLRIYLLVTSVSPLRCYLLKEGMARFCTNEYTAVKGSNLGNQFMHLTNYAINKKNDNYEFNEDAEAADQGSKRSMSSVFEVLKEQGCDTDLLWQRIQQLCIKTCLAVQPSLAHIYNTCFRGANYGSSCFEILGFDVMMDHKYKPWLIEVNHTPSFSTDTPFDMALKKSVIQSTFNMVAFTVEETRRIKAHQASSGLGMARKTKEETKAADAEFRTLLAGLRSDYEKANMGDFEAIYPCEDPALQAQYEHILQKSAESFEARTKARPSARPGVKKEHERERPRSAACSEACLLYTSPSPRDRTRSRMPSSA